MCRGSAVSDTRRRISTTTALRRLKRSWITTPEYSTAQRSLPLPVLCRRSSRPTACISIDRSCPRSARRCSHICESCNTDRSRGFQEADQLLAHDLWLFLLRPVAGTIHQLHSSEFRIPGLSGSLSASRDPVGAPVLFARNELRGDVDGPPRECELLGNVCGKRGTAVPIIVQRPGPP